jgi:hypothetical protein
MRVTWPPRNRSLGYADVLGLLGLVGFLTARFVPVATLPFWGCALRETTGWPCPACGLTRVAEHVSFGRVVEAWAINPLATVAAVAFAVLALAAVLHLGLGIPVPDVSLTPTEATRVRRVTVLALVGNYAYMIAKAKLPMWMGDL